VDHGSLKELYDAPEDQISFLAETYDKLEFDYTFQKSTRDVYHVPIMKTLLTQNIGGMLPGFVEEVELAFARCMMPTDGDSLASS
jgi:hypothetical protein